MLKFLRVTQVRDSTCRLVRSESLSLNPCLFNSSTFEMAKDHRNVENDTMTLKERFTLNGTQPSMFIVLSNTNATHFELKHAILQLLPTFYVKKYENSYTHVDEFLDICSTFKF